MTHKDDLQLVQRCLDQEPDAIREVGERLASIPRMVAIVNSRLRRTLSAEAEADASQEVFVLIWTRLATFQGHSTLEGWAWAFAENHTRNRVRRVIAERYRQDTSPRALDDQPMEPDPPPPVSRRTAESWLEGIQPVMAECIRLKHFHGLRFREIAERLDISPNTAKARYYRGIKLLRQALSNDQSEVTHHD